MDIAERRVPQDGASTFSTDTKEVDFSNFRVLLVYAPKAESDVGGGTRIIIDPNKFESKGVIDRLRQITTSN